MKLINLKLKYFKGIPSFELQANGGNVDVYGDNATGKTTLFDAFIWLFYGKDSQNKATFEIKTLVNGEAIHGIEHEVEGAIELNGKPLTLKKTYYEKWTQQRGSESKTFTGHTTDYFIDDVPVKEKEYVAQIEAIAKEDVFKLLSNPIFFSASLDWQKRRKIIIDACGGSLTEQDIINSNPALKDLPALLNGLDMAKFKEKVNAQKKRIADEMERIPIRIDETERGLPDVAGLSLVALQEDLKLLESKISEKQQEIQRIESGNEIPQKRIRIREIETEIKELRTEWQTKVNEDERKASEGSGPIKELIASLKAQKSADATKLEANNKAIAEAERVKGDFRAEWIKVNDSALEFNQKKVCLACGQAIPAEDLETFNLKKAQKLEQIVAEGTKQKTKIESLKDENAGLEKIISETETKLQKQTQKLSEIQTEVDAVKSREFSSPEAKNTEIRILREEIVSLESGSKDLAIKTKSELETLTKTANSIRIDIAKFGQIDRDRERIAELQKQQKQLAKEYEALERQVYLTEEFTRAKVSLLEEKINSKFQYARFKMFKVQVNGGIEECCETLFEGVPFSAGLNAGHQIVVGLDIINTLSEYYGLSLPIFIDNAESVSKYNIPEIKAQLIRLIKPDTDNEESRRMYSKLTVRSINQLREAV